MTAKWQDWASFALGLWLAVSPWLAGYAEHEAATGNAIIVGLVLALGSHIECVACDDLPVEWLNLAVGVWLVCAPFVPGVHRRRHGERELGARRRTGRGAGGLGAVARQASRQASA